MIDDAQGGGWADPEAVSTARQRRMVPLTRHECLQLLATRSVGRLGVITGSRPQIFPVNYRVYADGVAFRVGADGVLGGLSRPQPVAFQLDEVDEARQVGWSVLLQGSTRMVDDPVERERVLAVLQIPWAVGLRPRVIHVRADQLTGRRVLRVPPADPSR